jgi:prepilin-type N-terminal cleavage/methylation domain-containing protein
MNKNVFKKAFTLIELIVGLVLLSFIVMGIFSISSVLDSNHQDYGQQYLVKSETQTTLNHILNNASLAVGSGTSDSFGNQDLGILIGAGNPPGAGDANSFCIHQAGNNNIINSANDIWLCYTINANQIYWCTSTFAAATAFPSFRGAAAPCTAASANYTFLGTAFSISNPAAPTYTATNGFSITIQNCYNDSLGSCSATGTSTDPANNPEIQLSGSVTPPQEGM